MKLFLKIILSLIIIIAIIFTGGMIYITRGLKAGIKETVNGIDLASVSDGVYAGRYESGRWTNELEITVKDHKITDIKVIKDVMFPMPELAEELFDRVIEEQNTDIDITSGATVTGKAYLKSIENALSGYNK